MIYMVHGTNDWKTFSSSINGTAAVIPGLLPGIRYQVRIRAYSVLGNGEYGNSGIVSATSFYGDGANLTNVGMDTGTLVSDQVLVLGVTTSASAIVGSAVTILDIYHIA